MEQGVSLAFTTTVPSLKGVEEESLLKTNWEKEKLLETSIFSFSQNVFHLHKVSFHSEQYM